MISDIREILASAKVEDLRQLRNFVSLCIQLAPKDFQMLLAMINDAISAATQGVDTETDPVPDIPV